MWVLQSVEGDVANKEQACIWLCPQRSTYTIGRSGRNICFGGDSSVSRKHASLTVELPQNDTEPSRIYLVDEGSKYGTRRNGEMLQRDQNIQLSDGDLLWFGGNQSRLKLCFQPIRVCTSAVSLSTTKWLQEHAKNLDVQVFSQWTNECTHLIMGKRLGTEKALLALQGACPVVTIDWISSIAKLGEAHSGADPQALLPTNFELPNPIAFLPPSAEEDVNERVNWLPDPRRKTVMKDAIVLVADPIQHTKIQRLVEGSGGTCLLVNEPGQLESVVLQNGSERCFFHEPVPTDQDCAWNETIQRLCLPRLQQEDIGNAILHSTDLWRLVSSSVGEANSKHTEELPDSDSDATIMTEQMDMELSVVGEKQDTGKDDHYETPMSIPATLDLPPSTEPMQSTLPTSGSALQTTASTILQSNPQSPDEPDAPAKQYIVIEYRDDLIVKNPPTQRIPNKLKKKPRKVQPQIIGREDMYVYQEGLNAGKREEWLNVSPEKENLSMGARPFGDSIASKFQQKRLEFPKVPTAPSFHSTTPTMLRTGYENGAADESMFMDEETPGVPSHAPTPSQEPATQERRTLKALRERLERKRKA